MRWVGGKRSSLDTLLAEIERLRWSGGPGPHRYAEPFLGAGALFFALERRLGRSLEARLGDSLPAIVDVFRGVQRDPNALAARANAWPVERAMFDRLARETFADPNDRAARVLWLQRTSFNGLWREGPRGFNSTWGRPKPDLIVADVAQLSECCRALERAEIVGPEDFGWASRAKRGTLVYFDPPYLPDKPGAFTRYGTSAFGWPEHERLAALFDALVARGCWCLLSNSAGRVIEHRFRAYRLVRIRVPRRVAAKSAHRGDVDELLIVGGPGITPAVVESEPSPRRTRKPRADATTRVGPGPLVRVVAHRSERRRDRAARVLLRFAGSALRVADTRAPRLARRVRQLARFWAILERAVAAARSTP
jgi:DNA adenine methylase